MSQQPHSIEEFNRIAATNPLIKAVNAHIDATRTI